MNKTFEELKREFFPESEYYNNLVKSQSTGSINDALSYYRAEVYKTLDELEAYFGIKGYRTSEDTEKRKAA